MIILCKQLTNPFLLQYMLYSLHEIFIPRIGDAKLWRGLTISLSQHAFKAEVNVQVWYNQWKLITSSRGKMNSAPQRTVAFYHFLLTLR